MRTEFNYFLQPPLQFSRVPSILRWCVCLSCQSLHGRTHTAELYQIFVHVARSRGSILLLWRCDTLCTSGFLDVVLCVFSSGTRAASIPMKFCSTIKTGSSCLGLRIGAKNAIYDCLSIFVKPASFPGLL